MAISFTRSSTSKEILALDWHFPVAREFSDDKPKDGAKTSAARIEAALPRQEAFYKINGKGNKKPLLVLRECTLCKGTEHALFDRRLNNEKTMLLTQWFYCVKLPPKVMDANHAFRKVFKQEKPPHLFICSADGTNVTEFSGEQTQAELHKAMVALINLSYEKKPQPAVKAMLRFLSEFDKHDGMLQQYETQLQNEMLRKKPRKSNLAKLEKRIASVKNKRKTAMKRAKAVCDLKLKVVKDPAVVAPGNVEAAQAEGR